MSAAASSARLAADVDPGIGIVKVEERVDEGVATACSQGRYRAVGWLEGQ